MGRPCEWLSRKLALFKAQPEGSEESGTNTFFCDIYSLFCRQDAAKLMQKMVLGNRQTAGVMTQNVQTGLRLWEGLANGFSAS